MPELPEVETIRRGLTARILNQKITEIKVQNPKSFIGDPSQAKNRKIESINRRGKALIINLDKNLNLLIHLRMTGQVIHVSSAERFAAGHPTNSFMSDLPDNHTRAQITLANNSQIFFNDQRKFGFIKLLDSDQLAQDPFLKKLGPEPLADPLAKPPINALTAKNLHDRLQKRKNTTIKAALLDQTVLAGVGNIYADEALFHAKIHPARKVATIKPKETAKILKGIQKSMQASLASGGSTLSNYRQSDGQEGNYLDLFAQVFAKTGEPCPTCQTPITKTKVANRGTHLCPSCQKLL